MYLTAGEDFMLPPNGYVKAIFPAGSTTTSFDVIIFDDNKFEASESLRLAIIGISLPYGINLVPPKTSIMVILDNESKFTYIYTIVRKLFDRKYFIDNEVQGKIFSLIHDLLNFFTLDIYR